MPPAGKRATNGPLVRARGVSYCFGQRERNNRVLSEVSLAIDPGQLVVMTGPSGSGKTTLLTLIGALRSIQDGSIEVLSHDLAGLEGRDLVRVRRDIGFIFQLHNLFDSLSAYENVKMAMQLGDCRPADMRRRGVEILERLGLGDRIDHKPKALSGGQRQRVAVARALVNRPKLILADEPTAALDKESGLQVVALLRQLAEEQGSAVIMVTHDHRIVEQADRIVNMVDGTIVSDVVLKDALLICSFLHSVELFTGLTPTELTNVAERMVRRRYAPRQEIIRQGEVGSEFFLLAQGSVAVRRRDNGKDAPVAELKTGDFFGERALITGEPRNATVTALDEVEAFVLDKDSFRIAREMSASFHEQIFRAYFQRL